MENQEIVPIVESFFNIIRSKGGIIKNYKLENNVIKAGDNFCSAIARLKIEYLNPRKDAVKAKTVLIKIPSGGILFDQFKKSTFYLNEVLMYKVIFPEMYKHTDKPFTAKCFFVSESNDLVLEDLNAIGYRVVEKKMQLDFDHAKMVLKKLALFHALSVKLYETAPRKVETIKQLDGSKVDPEVRRRMELMFEKFINTLQAMSISSITIKKLREFKRDRMWEEIHTETLRVLCHGDLHLNNVLFKYDADGKVCDARLIDFQVSHKGSPVTDLIYFFVGSVQVHVFLAHHEYLLQYYYNHFQKNLSALKCSSKYTRKDFNDDLESHKLYYLRVLGMILGLILTNFAKKIGNSEKNDENAFISGIYRYSIKKWIKFLKQNNTI